MSAEVQERGVHLPSLSVQLFRGIGSLSIPKLSQVTLIAGKNNTGKTSILEAVRLLTEEATPEVIREILQFREENTDALASNWETDNYWNFFVSALFNGFPRLTEVSQPISIASCNGHPRVEMRVEWFLEQVADTGRIRRIPAEQADDDWGDIIPALVVATEQGKREYPIERLDRQTSIRPLRQRERSSRLVSRLVGAIGTERTEALGPLWDNISLTDNESYIVEALQVIDPQVTAFAMIGEQSVRQSRTAVVYSKAFGRRVPLRSFGEGMNRILGIILSLVNVADGILLIDEFENGMHYTVQADAWRMVFRIAHTLNVQVIATTHSFDCVAGFRQAATEQEEVDGLLVRVDRIGDRMRTVEYTEEDLEIAVRQRIEVR